MTIPARISIVTLGVQDVARSSGSTKPSAGSAAPRRWTRSPGSATADGYLGIFGWKDLAEDAQLVEPTRGSFGGITLAINVETREMVDAAIDEAIAGRSLTPEAGHRAALRLWRLLRRSATATPGRSAGTPASRSARTAGSRSTEMADLAHRATRLVEQDPAVVHDRVLELAKRLRDEAPTIEPGSQPAMLLGTSGSLGIELRDVGPGRIELTTTQGRIRGHIAADIAPADGGRTNLAIAVSVEPKGMAAGLMLGAALGARPNIRQRPGDRARGGDDGSCRRAREARRRVGRAAWQPRILADARG